MSTSNSGMLTALSRYFGKVETHILPAYFNDNVQLAANAQLNIDLKTLVSDHAEYHLHSANIVLRLLDNESGSATNGWFINAEAIATAAISTAGLVRIVNNSAEAITLCVRVDKPTVKK